MKRASLPVRRVHSLGDLGGIPILLALQKIWQRWPSRWYQKPKRCRKKINLQAKYIQWQLCSDEEARRHLWQMRVRTNYLRPSVSLENTKLQWQQIQLERLCLELWSPDLIFLVYKNQILSIMRKEKQIKGMFIIR